MHRRILIDAVVAKLNASTSHRHVQLLLLLLLLQKGDDKEIRPQVKVGTNPQESLTQGNERRNVLNPIRSEML